MDKEKIIDVGGRFPVVDGLLHSVGLELLDGEFIDRAKHSAMNEVALVSERFEELEHIARCTGVVARFRLDNHTGPGLRDQSGHSVQCTQLVAFDIDFDYADAAAVERELIQPSTFHQNSPGSEFAVHIRFQRAASIEI